ADSTQRGCKSPGGVPVMPGKMAREGDEATERRRPAAISHVTEDFVEQPIEAPDDVVASAPRGMMRRRRMDTRPVWREDSDRLLEHALGASRQRAGVLPVFGNLRVMIDHRPPARELEVHIIVFGA